MTEADVAQYIALQQQMETIRNKLEELKPIVFQFVHSRPEHKFKCENSALQVRAVEHAHLNAISKDVLMQGLRNGLKPYYPNKDELDKMIDPVFKTIWNQRKASVTREVHLKRATNRKHKRKSKFIEQNEVLVDQENEEEEPILDGNNSTDIVGLEYMPPEVV